jgi:muramoyltetrapeptide carboxypeptidase
MRFLKMGDIVDVIAPSGYGYADYLREIREYIENLGLKANIPDNILSKDDIFYANNNSIRTKLFIDAVTNDRSSAIWAIRGGEGASEIIRLLNDEPSLPVTLPEKLLIGYSDISVLHLYMHDNYGWATVQGSMLGEIVTKSRDPQSVCELESLIFGHSKELQYDKLSLISDSAQRVDKVSGEITGGNLTIVEMSIGTSWEIDACDKILFLEDIGGHAYMIERSLTHLIEAGVLDEVKAVLFGDIIEVSDQELVPQVMQRFAKKINVPVFHIEGIGHGYTNHPLPFNVGIATLCAESLMLFIST